MTGSQLERWRSGGYLPTNNRSGLGRGAGSRSELVAGMTDYVEALALLAGQGRPMHQVMLTMFMVGAVDPERCSADDPLGMTYEAAIRRAFLKEIQEADQPWNRVAAHLAASHLDRELAVDGAFAEAESLAHRRAGRHRIRLEETAAKLSGTIPRTPDEIRREEEQALLAANGFDEHDEEVTRSLWRSWDTGLAPLDIHIWTQPPCRRCASRTASFPTSPTGRRNILDASSFAELNQARAIGGAVCIMVAAIRDAATKSPTDTVLRRDMAICSNTAFRMLLPELPKVGLQSPGSIVPCTTFFLTDCRWIKAGAALLMQLALNHMPAANGDARLPATVAGTIVKTIVRTGMLRLFKDGATMMLQADGLNEAAKILKLHDRTQGDDIP